LYCRDSFQYTERVIDPVRRILRKLTQGLCRSLVHRGGAIAVSPGQCAARPSALAHVPTAAPRILAIVSQFYRPARENPLPHLAPSREADR